MIAFINPPYGNDDTGIVSADESAARARPFKTHKVGFEALQKSKDANPERPHVLKESHKKPPAPNE